MCTAWLSSSWMERRVYRALESESNECWDKVLMHILANVLQELMKLFINVQLCACVWSIHAYVRKCTVYE